MDIKRSNRIKKAAAIAALVLVVGSAGVAAEAGNVGFLAGNVVSAEDESQIAKGSRDTQYHFIKTESDFTSFVNAAYTDDKIHVAQILVDTLSLSGGYEKLSADKVVYGDGSKIIITGNKALFNTIEKDARIENVDIEADRIESTDTVGAVCCVNNGEIRYVNVKANVFSKVDVNDPSNCDKPSGIVCGVNNGKIFGCVLEGTLDSQNYYIGSICGKNVYSANENEGVIERCSSSVKITFATNVEITAGKGKNKKTYTYTSECAGGLCGSNDGKMYDCIFQGELPHESDAEAHRRRRIGGLCGELTENGYIRNSIYNGRRLLTKEEYRNNNANKDYYSIGRQGAKAENTANTYRLDTYYYPNYNGAVRTYFSNYHATSYTNEVVTVNDEDFKGKDSIVLRNLNDGYDVRPTAEERKENVWEPGDFLPKLCLDNFKLECVLEKNDITYDGKEHELVKPLKIEKGFAAVDPKTNKKKIQYSLDNKTWSSEIPKRIDAGKYTVYYKVEGGKGYHNAVGSFEAEIAPKPLALIAENLDYTGSTLDTTNAISFDTNELCTKNGKKDECGITNIRFTKVDDTTNTILKEIVDIGHYTVSADATNTNYKFDPTVLAVNLKKITEDEFKAE